MIYDVISPFLYLSYFMVDKESLFGKKEGR